MTVISPVAPCNPYGRIPSEHLPSSLQACACERGRGRHREASCVRMKTSGRKPPAATVSIRYRAILPLIGISGNYWPYTSRDGRFPPRRVALRHAPSRDKAQHERIRKRPMAGNAILEIFYFVPAFQDFAHAASSRSPLFRQTAIRLCDAGKRTLVQVIALSCDQHNDRGRHAGENIFCSEGKSGRQR